MAYCWTRGYLVGFTQVGLVRLLELFQLVFALGLLELNLQQKILDGLIGLVHGLGEGLFLLRGFVAFL